MGASPPARPPDRSASHDRTPRLTLGAPVDERDYGVGVRVAIVAHLDEGAEHGVQPSSSLHVVKAGYHHPELHKEDTGAENDETGRSEAVHRGKQDCVRQRGMTSRQWTKHSPGKRGGRD